MKSEVKDQFDAVSENYDGQRRKVVPGFDEFYGTATYFADSITDTPRILDLGAGTGLFSAFVLKKYPDAQLTLLDVSDKMLDVARDRFAGNGNVRYVAADYCTSGISGTFDLIISALSIHHLEDKDKKRLFENVYAALTPHGMFVNADQHLAESSRYAERFEDYWRDYVNRFEHSQEDMDRLMRRRQLDKEAKLSDQIQWLRDAGFQTVECVYKHALISVMVAEKSSG
jgi:tRNA (cmo5U34)-methyltransferase